MINLTISGKVGRDAKELENGCVFTIGSTKKGFTTKDGRKIEDKTVWFSVFGHKNLTPYVKKGDSLTIYTDDITADVYDGKANLSCRAISIEFGGKSGQSNSPAEPTAAEPQDNLPF